MRVIWEQPLRLRRNQERYRWYALGVTTFTQAAASAVTSALGPIAPLIMAEFAISRAQVGLVQTSIYLSGTWSAMVGGRIADRAGERSALIVSGFDTPELYERCLPRRESRDHRADARMICKQALIPWRTVV
jgi:hypothetical protein